LAIQIIWISAMMKDDAGHHVTDDRAESNWSLCVVSVGNADANTAARAAIYVQHALRHDYDLLTDMTVIDQLTDHDRIELLARAQDAWDRAPQDTMKAVFEWRGKNYVVSHSSVQLRIHTEEGIKVY
jgi:hypothetical protein